MKKIFLIALLFLTACKTQQLPPERHETREVVRTEYIEKLRDTTIYITLPVEVREQIIRIGTRDTCSTIETSLAISRAVLYDGFLHHFIQNKDTVLKAEIIYRDIIRTRDSIRDREVEIPYAVPAEFTKWQKFYMDLGQVAFWVFIVAFAAGIIIGWRKFKRR